MTPRPINGVVMPLIDALFLPAGDGSFMLSLMTVFRSNGNWKGQPVAPGTANCPSTNVAVPLLVLYRDPYRSPDWALVKFKVMGFAGVPM